MNSLSNVAVESASSQSKALDYAAVELLEKLALMSLARGCPVKAYTQKALSTLATLPLDKKENLIKKLETTIKIVVAGTEIEKNNPPSGYAERSFVEQALEIYGYELKDEEFWNTVRKDELVEIYNTDNIQIFRTFNFFTTSSYSILDLLINEWYSLWERPNGTLDNMFKVVGALFSGETKGIVSAGVREHVISEIFNAEDQEHFASRASLCKFGVICPIYSKLDGQIAGLLVTARVTPVAVGEQAKSISFI
ncbi:hypothetical protein CIK05_08180 [Bdellovibrio sp. qaytius]|nr:hypothetical protein CIK05_08180 [Bdellovibrio sp. qaytius]